METIKGYLLTNKNEQVVFSQLYWPKSRDSYKRERDYKKIIEVWRKSFINVLHARPMESEGIGCDILISNPKDDSLIAEYGNECLVSLKKKGVLVLCIKSFGSWTKGYGVFADTPDKAIGLYKEYVEWLKLYHKNPKLFSPAKFSEH